MTHFILELTPVEPRREGKPATYRVVSCVELENGPGERPFIVGNKHLNAIAMLSRRRLNKGAVVNPTRELKRYSGKPDEPRPKRRMLTDEEVQRAGLAAGLIERCDSKVALTGSGSLAVFARIVREAT